MYKLFLTIRYLTRKKIVIFPILVVWLCLMMMIIVTSIMGGFVDRVRETNREVMGDIIIWSPASAGWAGYQELQDELKVKFPEIEAMTPVVKAFGLANVPEKGGQTVPVEVMGIDPVGRAQVSRYKETLFRGYISPHEGADDLSRYLPGNKADLIAGAKARIEEAQKEWRDSDSALSAAEAAERAAVNPWWQRINYWWLLGILVVAGVVFLMVRPRSSRTGWSVVWGGVFGLFGLGIVALGVLWPVLFSRQYELAEDRWTRAQQSEARAQRALTFAWSLPDRRYTTKQELLDALVPAEPSFDLPPQPPVKPGEHESVGCVVGTQLGFFRRDKRGNFDRTRSADGIKMLVTVYPASEKSGSVSEHGVTRPFVIVDDSYSGVFSIDETAVYAPFQTVQLMAGMRADPEAVAADPTSAFPPRCNEILIRLKDRDHPALTRLTRARINDFVQSFMESHLEFDLPNLNVQTWDERQAKYLGAVENEKVMQTFILGLMSMVVLVVIFLIFYMIVRDKTRDIGIIKAIGGSEEGVAGIFLTYGLFIGVVGGILGVICGVAFVTHTNEIHEWIYQMTGIVIWDRSVYLFDRIPDTVHPREVAIYFCLALLAGVIGALIPAIVAGSEDPVKAVRYE